MIAPFLKWAGGKRYLAEEILKRLPRKVDVYYEPMVGAGAIFFELAKQGRFNSAVLNDINKELINSYEVIKNNVSQLVIRLKTLEDGYRRAKWKKDHFYKVREVDTTLLTNVDKAARTIYLNKTCYSGLYRVNKSGGFNVPFGDYTNPPICNEQLLREVSKALTNVTFSNIDYEKALSTITINDSTYIDPPYYPINKNSFRSYTSTGFSKDEQLRLSNRALKLKSAGVHAVLSNSDVPMIRKLYKGFIIDTVMAPRRINSNGTGRGVVSEVLIMTKELI